MRSWIVPIGLTLCCMAAPGLARASATDGPSASAIQELARSPSWLRLLHYHRSFPFGRLKSEVDSPGFFLSPDGRGDPEAELRADLEASQSPPARCGFPVRYELIRQELKLELPTVACP